MTSNTGTEPAAPARKASRLATPIIALAVAAAANFLVALMDRGPRPELNGIAGVLFTLGALAFAVAAYRASTGRDRRA